jgi:uncharacterized membrane protein YhaH (DUF805 family)
MNWYQHSMKHYATFSGRARRTEFWMYLLVYVVMVVVASVLDALLGTAGLLGGLVALVHIIPSLALQARRLHDIDRSGWWMLIWFIPLIGWLILLYWNIKEGDTGSNRFGASPKGEPEAWPQP